MHLNYGPIVYRAERGPLPFAGNNIEKLSTHDKHHAAFNRIDSVLFDDYDDDDGDGNGNGDGRQCWWPPYNSGWLGFDKCPAVLQGDGERREQI